MSKQTIEKHLDEKDLYWEFQMLKPFRSVQLEMLELISETF
jgi:hypothetical protein